MRIIAFITDAPTVRDILGHLGPQQACGAARCHRKWMLDPTGRLLHIQACAVESPIRQTVRVPRAEAALKRSIRIALITVAAAWIALSYKVSGIAHSNETEYWYAAALAKLDCIDGSMPPLRRVFASDGRTK